MAELGLARTMPAPRRGRPKATMPPVDVRETADSDRQELCEGVPALPQVQRGHQHTVRFRSASHRIAASNLCEKDRGNYEQLPRSTHKGRWTRSHLIGSFQATTVIHSFGPLGRSSAITAVRVGPQTRLAEVCFRARNHCCRHQMDMPRRSVNTCSRTHRSHAMPTPMRLQKHHGDVRRLFGVPRDFTSPRRIRNARWKHAAAARRRHINKACFTSQKCILHMRSRAPYCVSADVPGPAICVFFLPKLHSLVEKWLAPTLAMRIHVVRFGRMGLDKTGYASGVSTPTNESDKNVIWRSACR